MKYYQNVKNWSIFSYATFYFENQVFSCYNRLFKTSNTWFSRKKSHIWKNWSVFNIFVIFQLILKVLQLHFLNWSFFSYILTLNSKSAKCPVFPTLQDEVTKQCYKNLSEFKEIWGSFKKPRELSCYKKWQKKSQPRNWFGE